MRLDAGLQVAVVGDVRQHVAWRRHGIGEGDQVGPQHVPAGLMRQDEAPRLEALRHPLYVVYEPGGDFFQLVTQPSAGGQGDRTAQMA